MRCPSSATHLHFAVGGIGSHIYRPWRGSGVRAPSGPGRGLPPFVRKKRVEKDVKEDRKERKGRKLPARERERERERDQEEVDRVAQDFGSRASQVAQAG